MSNVDRRMFSVVTDQGTAMAEATLCAMHYEDPTLRGFAEVVAVDADDLTGPVQWQESTGNEAVRCQECPADDAPHDCPVCDAPLRVDTDAPGWYVCTECGAAHTSQDCCA